MPEDYLLMGEDGLLHYPMSDEYLNLVALRGQTPLNKEYLDVIDNLYSRYYYRLKLLELNMRDTEDMTNVLGYDSKFNLTNRKITPNWKGLSSPLYLQKLFSRLRSIPLYDGIVKQVNNAPNLDKDTYYKSELKPGTLGKSYDWRFNYKYGNGAGLQGVSSNGKLPFAAVFPPAYSPNNLPYLNKNDAHHELDHSIDFTSKYGASPSVLKVQQIRDEMIKNGEWFANPEDTSKKNLNYDGGTLEHVRVNELWEYLRLKEEEKYKNDANWKKQFDSFTLKLKLQYWYNFYNLKFKPEDFDKGGKYYDFARKRFPALTPKAASRLLNEVAVNKPLNNQEVLETFYAKKGIKLNPKNKGKFTETKKRTGKTTEELTHSKNPLTRKRAIFALNAKKWKHANGGIIYAGDGNTLPELVVKPSAESHAAVEYARLMFPDKNMRTAILRDYDKWAIDELGVPLTTAIMKLYDLHKKSGFPKVSTKTSLIMGSREHYDPVTNTIYVPDPTFDGYVAELPHAYLKASGRWNWSDLAGDIVTHPGEWLGNASEDKDDRPYKREGSYENDAHEVIEPAFWDYIEGKPLNIPKKAKKHFLGGRFQGLATDNGIVVSKDKNVSKSKPKVKLVKKKK